MSRLPQPGGDSGTWGDVLNDYLSQIHTSNGSLKDNVVTNAAIAPGAITSAEIAPDTITATQIADGTITEVQLDTATQNKLNTAGSGNVADGTITSVKLHDDAVTTLKLADDAVAGGKIADGAVTSAKIATGTIVDSNISSSAAITQSKVANLVSDLAGKAAAIHTHTASQITDSTTTGRLVLAATDAAAVRAVIGAGTSNLAIGTSSTTAKAGDYVPAWGEITSKPSTFTPSDAGVVNLVQNTGSSTRAALDVLYTVPAEVRTGPAPAATVHADAGTGASITFGGTRIALRATITTGTTPTSGGTLATFALTGYTLAPVVSVNPRDEASVATFPYATTSTTLLTLKAAGELEPSMSYAYDLIIMGL